MTGFVLHPDAYADLVEIWDYIATENLDAADRVRDEIFEAMENFVAFPEHGHLRPDLTSRPLRFHPVRDFLITYAPAENPIVVIGNIHGRRNPRVIAAMLRARE